jgi:lysophospholipid acyltransferase (LPLAT)-like uncharacterized protein
VSEWKYKAASALGTAFLNSLFASCKFIVEGQHHLDALRRTGKPFVYALWHGRLLALGYHHRNENVGALISRSADGEYIARVLENWGFIPARGSSSRGGMPALREMVRIARAGHCLAITPDGPRGPRQQVKPGLLVAAQLAGMPVLPITAACSNAWWPGKWDRFLIPKPFSTIRIAHEAPLCIARDAGPEELEQKRQELEDTLNRMTQELDRKTESDE